MDEIAFLRELSPAAEQLFERHLASAKEWFPHEYVPWGEGRDFEPDEQWSEEASSMGLSPALRSALLVNLLTEDNLPYYFATIDRIFGSDHPWPSWTRRWTAEEMRHGAVIRDFLTVTRAVDPVALERARMAQVAGGVTPQPPTAADGFAYLTLQELATRISHRNTGKAIDDERAFDLMSRVSTDENLHYLFYRDVAAAALEVDPSTMVLAIDRQARNFEMPGTGIPDFATHARAIASTGIYDFAVHHDQILVPVLLRHWKLEEIEGLSPEAEEARARVLAFVERMGRVADRINARRDEQQAA